MQNASGKIVFRIDDPVDIDLLCMRADDHEERILQVKLVQRWGRLSDFVV